MKIKVKQIITWKGKQARVERISPRTGALTIQMLEVCGAYKVGDQVSVMPYEIIQRGADSK